MRRAGFSFLFSLLTFFFSGCATAPPPPVADVEAAWQARAASLKPIATWALRGRLALRAADQGWHATLNWERNGENHRMDFTGPLGRGHLRLVQDSQGAELRDADQHVWREADAGRLLYRATGWVVPLDGLNYWVLGLPMPGPAHEQELDTLGRLRRLTQSGWDIRFLEYTRLGTHDLPSRINITRHHGATPPGDETLEVRLSIEQWQLP